MATAFSKPGGTLGHISGDPQKDSAPDKVLVAGLDHRPFSEDEIKQAFDTFDLDQNHFVGATEIRHILDVIGEEATDEEVDEMIRMCDSDGKGQVTYDEFYTMMTQPPAPKVTQTAKAKSRSGGATAKYGPGRPTTQSSTGDLNHPQAPQSKKGKQAIQAGADASAQQAQQFRATSVEALVRKLSGGMEKIKPSQIKKVYKRFQDIDEDHSGAIDYHEFCQALEMQDNTISKMMFRVFDMDGSGTIELKEFIVVLSRYTSAAKTEKLKFAFMMFDEDSSGMIEREELIEMLQASFVVEGFSREILEDKADMVYEFLDLDHDAGIGYEDFLKLASAKNGLIYPIEEASYTMETTASAVSLNAALEQSGG